MNIKELQATLSLREKVALCISGDQLSTEAMPEHNIPKLIMTDGTNGVRIFVTPAGDPREAEFRKAINASFDSEEALAVTADATCFPTGSSPINLKL